MDSHEYYEVVLQLMRAFAISSSSLNNATPTTYQCPYEPVAFSRKVKSNSRSTKTAILSCLLTHLFAYVSEAFSMEVPKLWKLGTSSVERPSTNRYRVVKLANRRAALSVAGQEGQRNEM